MTTPDVPYRFEVTLDVPGTLEQVWEAIATKRGIESWMTPVDLDARAGGEVVFHMGPDMDSHGRITGYDPPRRIAYEEDWATLAGHPGADVTPMATEFMVEAGSGGTCVVRVITSAYGIGADWEKELWDDMASGWGSIIDNLRLVLTHFPGQRATIVSVASTTGRDTKAMLGALLADLGVEAPGDRFDGPERAGVLERRQDGHALVRLDGPLPGLLSFFAFADREGGGSLALQAHLFAPEGASVDVDAQQEGWQAWLDAVIARAAAAEA